MKYLASPYSDPDLAVMQQRYEAARDATARLMLAGEIIFSPIVHCHFIAAHHDLPKTYEFWLTYDLHMIDLAETLLVLRIPGWEQSRGVTAEMAHARYRDIPIEFVDVEDGQ